MWVPGKVVHVESGLARGHDGREKVKYMIGVIYDFRNF